MWSDYAIGLLNRRTVYKLLCQTIRDIATERALSRLVFLLLSVIFFFSGIAMSIWSQTAHRSIWRLLGEATVALVLLINLHAGLMRPTLIKARIAVLEWGRMQGVPLYVDCETVQRSKRLAWGGFCAGQLLVIAGSPSMIFWFLFLVVANRFCIELSVSGISSDAVSASLLFVAINSGALVSVILAMMYPWMAVRFRVRRSLCPECGFHIGISPRCNECGLANMFL